MYLRMIILISSCFMVHFLSWNLIPPFFLLSGNNGSRGRDRTLTGRLSLAADFFHLNLMSSKERDRTTDSGTSSQHNSSSNSSQKRLTWNPFRTKSRERSCGSRHQLSDQMAAMTLKTPSPGTSNGDNEVICKNIIMRGWIF